MVIQRVSEYGSSRPGGKAIVYFLIFIIILLLGVLAAVFFFKDEVINILNNFGLS